MGTFVPVYQRRVGRRQTKHRHLTIVEFFRRAGKLTTEQAEEWNRLFRKCVQPEDFTQVSQALRSFVSGIPTTRRHALIRRNDEFDDLLEAVE